ncbi:MAG: CcmD family protein [Anaerolineaceae bacterium]|nr:CcmD family protein [Anaerolineaceae bacterium]
MDAPAQTLNYMIAGFTIIFTALIGYTISLVVRIKKLHEEEQFLNDTLED